MITIGEFALSTGVSVKALRFYDDRGLLTPAEVDPHSGYRRYSAAQMRTATTIRILRTAGSAWRTSRKPCRSRTGSPTCSRPTPPSSTAGGIWRTGP